jgi:hypothetical protein
MVAVFRALGFMKWKNILFDVYKLGRIHIPPFYPSRSKNII